MKREILLHRELDHPNIIKLHGHLEDTENVYLVLELADRGSLFHEIRRLRKLGEDKARGYFRQVCEAVQYLHEHEIIHRDIKPENILLDKTGSIKLCDFGWCAKGTETRTTFCGTLDYMAPEMVMGGGHSFSIDLWALGVLLYELVHGSAPFTARKESDKCRQILNSSYTVDPSLSPALHTLVASLLQPRPEDRLPVSQVLAHEWVQNKCADLVQIGSALKSYVKGYGIAEGQVTAIEGEYCTVYFQAPDVTEQMSVSRAEKILKRKPVKVPEPPSSSVQEAALLDQIEEWCNTPASKIPAKPDKFLALLEQSNKQLEESLQRLNKAKGAGLEADEAGLKVEIEKVEAVMLETFDYPETTTPGETPSGPDIFPEPEQRDTEKQPFTPKGFSKPNLTIDPDLIESSHETSGFSPLGSTQSMGDEFDFEAERQKIEERNQMFYCLTEEKWAERSSRESLVKAPRLRARDPHIESSSTQLIQEMDLLAFQTKRSVSKSPQNLQALEHANAALHARKAQLESLLIEMEKPLPKVHKPIKRKPGQTGKDGFLRWIGSMIGCGDRA
jgi:serine/threonine protein kinase